MASNSGISHILKAEQVRELLKPQSVCLMRQVHQNQIRSKPEPRLLVMSLWRAYLVLSKQPVRVESSFNYLEISSINILSLSQVVIETDTQTFSLSLTRVADLEAMVSHMTASLKKIFPDSSPGKILKKIPPDLQERLRNQASSVEEHIGGTHGPCGGFSDTFAALCDFNEFPCKEEVQWDVDNIYYVHGCKEFSLLDFSHLDNRDLALAVAALSFNQWFTRISSRHFKLSPDVQQQVLFMINRSPSLEELSLEASGLRVDFAVKMATALQEHDSSALHSINLSANQIEDKGVIALSQELKSLPRGLSHLSLSRTSVSAKGVGVLSQVFSSNQVFSSCLTHLDLSDNPGSLATEDATSLFKFLSGINSVSYLDLSGTDCPLDTLFVSLSAGCCSKLAHLQLATNPFTYRKGREVTRSVREFFSHCAELQYCGLSGTKLPSQALRLLLQGLATNTQLSGLELDLSSCELRSCGAQVIQEHIFEAKAINSLDLSDNGLESDMVTLVLSIGRSPSIRHLALGRNFTMKSRALTDVLQRIVQLVQEEECPLESLSVCDSKLKTGTTILINALASSCCLRRVDLSGNAIGDTGAKMLAKALLINTTLRSLVWDRNNVTARGFQDVANAMDRNVTLQHMPLPLADVIQGCRHSPDRTEQALQQIQACLLRNNQRGSGCPDRRLQQGLKTAQSEQMIQGLCQRLQNSLGLLNPCNVQEVQEDIVSAEEVLHRAQSSIRLLPSLWELDRAPSSDETLQRILNDTATALTNEITGEIQDLSQALLFQAQAVCPGVAQRSDVVERLEECVMKRSRQAELFIQDTLLQQAGQTIRTKLREVRQTISLSLVESIIDQVLKDLTEAQKQLDHHIREHTGSAPRTNNIPQLRLVEQEFPTDEYVPVTWRNSFHSKSIRPAPSVKSLLDVDWEQQARERERERESSMHYPHEEAWGWGGGGGGRGGELSGREGGARGRAHSSAGALLSVDASGQRRAVGSAHPGRQADAAAQAPARSPAPSSTEPRMDLPTAGQALRHYTRSRPRPPQRTHTQPPSKPPPHTQEEADNENDGSETMGRVDEGVEEFFTKKILPDDPLKAKREELPDQAPPTDPSSASPAPPITSTDPPTSTTSEAPPTSTLAPPTTPALPSFPSATSAPPSSAPPSSAPPSSAPPSSAPPSSVPSKNIKKKFGDFFAFKKVRAGRVAKGEGGSEAKVKKTSIADLIRPLREAARAEKEREREREREKERGKERGKVEEAAANDSDAAVTEGGASEDKMAPEAPPSDGPAPSDPPATLPTPVSPMPAPAEDDSAPAGPGPAPYAVAAPQAERERSRTLEKSRTPDEGRRVKVARRSLREGKSQSLILLTGLESEDGAGTHGKKHASETASSFEQRLHVMLHRIGVAKTPPADSKTRQKKDEELRKANSEGAILDSKPEPPPTFLKPRTMSSSTDTRKPTRGATLDSLHSDKPPVPDRPMGPLPPKPTIAAKPPPPTPAARPSPSLLPASQHPTAPRTSPVAPHQPSPALEGQPADPTPPQVPPRETAATATGPSPAPKKDPAPAPSPRRGLSSLECRERSERAQSVTEESLPKPRPRMKPLPQRRAVSVHEDALRDHIPLLAEELMAALPRLQRSPVRKRANLGELPPCSEDTPEGEGVGGVGGEEEKREERKAEKRTGGGQTADTRPVPVVDPGPDTGPALTDQDNSTQERGETVLKQHKAKSDPSDQRTEPPLSERHMD